MEFANVLVAIAMAFLGYAVFVFTAENYNPIAIPAKNGSRNESRRNHLLGLLAGGLVALSCLAAWFLSSGSFFAGLKASFMVAIISLLLLLVGDLILNWYRKRQAKAQQLTYRLRHGEDHQLGAEKNQKAVDVERSTALKQESTDNLGLIQPELDSELTEKTKTINELQSSIEVMQKEAHALNEKAIRLGDTEAELKSVRDELEVLKLRDQESRSSSETTIEKLRVENLKLQEEAKRANELKLELENNRLEVSKLKSENERHIETRSVFEQRDKELQTKLEHAALKERAGRLKMEVSAKKALGIARKAVDKLNEHEKKFLK